MTSYTPIAQGLVLVTACAGPSRSYRPSSEAGDPIVNEPGGIEMTSGHSSQSRQRSPGVRAGSFWAMALVANEIDAPTRRLLARIRFTFRLSLVWNLKGYSRVPGGGSVAARRAARPLGGNARRNGCGTGSARRATILALPGVGAWNMETQCKGECAEFEDPGPG